MKKVAIAIGVLGIGLLTMGVIAFASPLTLTHGHYSNLSISMAISRGWSLSVDQWKIDGDGNVTYEGSGSRGSRNGSGKISPQQVDELVAAINKSDLWAVKDGSIVGGILCNDCPKVDVSITFQSWSKHFTYFDSLCEDGFKPLDGYPAPGALCDLQHQIEGLGTMGAP